ncbi:MAG: hypothetical protein WCX31_00855 [Salinivirgaceae bacterium]
MKKTVTLFFALMMFFNFNATFAQEEAEESPLSLGADIVSRYVWRGMQLSTSPAIQPSIEYSFGNLTVGTWGSYSFDHVDNQEVDLFVTYTYESFAFTLNDYYSFNTPGNYFEWNNDSTQHAVELMATWSGTESLPLSVTAGVFLYGFDKDDAGKNSFSSYVEVSYPFDVKGVTLSPVAGVALNGNMYATDGFGLVNLGVKAEKEIEINEKFSLPVSASLLTNPDAGDVFLVFGFSF